MKKYKMNDEEQKVYGDLPSRKKKMYSAMTHKQRKRFAKMSGKPAESYMYACMTENREYTGKDLMDEMLGMTDDLNGNLSHVNENNQKKEYFCKYCSLGFVTEEEVEKHQKTCAATL